jgi:hypothetical protein
MVSPLSLPGLTRQSMKQRHKDSRKDFARGISSWMRGSSPRMTFEMHNLSTVMPALVAGIHVLLVDMLKGRRGCPA